MTELRLKKHGNTLVPADVQSSEALLAISPNQTLKVKVKIARNPQRHKLYWGLMGKLAENSEYTKEALHHAFKLATGQYTEMTIPGGRVIKVPTSTSFDTMTEPAFCAYLNKVREILLHKVYPNLSEAEIWQIEQFFTPKDEAHYG